MTVLAFDIGNSRISIGLFKGKKLSAPVHLTSSGISPRDARNVLLRYLRKLRIEADDLSGIVITSVVPRTTHITATLCRASLHKEPLIISGRLDVGMKIRYRHRTTLGADRICAAVGAFAKYKQAVIIIDAGTATTISVVSEKGEFLGGAIAPGIRTSATALHRKTAQLPEIPLKFPKSVIGGSTKESIQSGILFGTVSLIEGIVRRTKLRTGIRTKVILTGGFARLLAPKADIADAVDPALVLRGARLVYERVTKKGERLRSPS